MLRRLEIRDLALIEAADLELKEGLTVLTGETGAGKSLLIGAIKGLTGDRMGREWVRSGAERATLDAVWDRPLEAVPADLLASVRGVALPEATSEQTSADADAAEPTDTTAELNDDLYLGREILAEGRSVNRIDGRLSPLRNIRSVGTYLADIHGQHDTQAIFRWETHEGMLDRFGREAIDAPLAAYRELWRTLAAIRRREKALVADPEARERVLDQLRYQIGELEELDPKPGEDEALALEFRKLSQSDRFRDYLGDALGAFEGDGYASDADEVDGVLPGLGIIEQALMDATTIDPTLEALSARLTLLKEEAEDVHAEVLRRMEDAEADPGRLDEVGRRLDRMSRMKRKYGDSIEKMLRYLERAREKLEELETGEQKLAALAAKRQATEKKLRAAATALTAARTREGERLSAAITAELRDLGMEHARFLVAIRERPDDSLSATGQDRVEFLLQANPGEEAKPLAKIASGGEASRIMLAIKVILAEADPIPLLVFDEIDSGVSGATATKVGRKLWRLGRTHQVLCVTHSAQIAALADTHFLIEKSVRDDRTRTTLTVLDHEARMRELARILSGDRVTDEALDLAQGLLQEARAFEATR